MVVLSLAEKTSVGFGTCRLAERVMVKVELQQAPAKWVYDYNTDYPHSA